jgi:hypothetical protein
LISKNIKIKIYKRFVWMWKLVFHPVGGTYGENVGNMVLRGIFGPERDE